MNESKCTWMAIKGVGQIPDNPLLYIGPALKNFLIKLLIGYILWLNRGGI
jgi:hypothetical protein